MTDPAINDTVEFSSAWLGGKRIGADIQGIFIGIGHHGQPEVRLPSGAIIVVPWIMMKKAKP